jgi:hypothetical protein
MFGGWTEEGKKKREKIFEAREKSAGVGSVVPGTGSRKKKKKRGRPTNWEQAEKGGQQSLFDQPAKTADKAKESVLDLTRVQGDLFKEQTTLLGKIGNFGRSILTRLSDEMETVTDFFGKRIKNFRKRTKNFGHYC